MISSNVLVESPGGHSVVRDSEGPSCGLCGGSMIEPLYYKPPASESAVRMRVADAIPEDGYTIVRCKECGLGFVYPIPDASDDELYGNSYYTARPLTGKIADILIKKQLPPTRRQFEGCIRQDMKTLEYLRSVLNGSRPHFDPQSVRYLDVGCGTGESLSAARQLGWSGVGTDVAPPAIEFGRVTLGLDIRAGVLEEIGFPDASFDIVTLREVLEHLREPSGLLKQIHRILSPSGVLYVQVPNDLTGYRARVFRKTWHLIPPIHLQYFTLLSLTKMLARNGFATCAHGSIGAVGRDLLRYAWWRMGILKAVDQACYRSAGLSILVRGIFRAAGDLFSPVDRYLEKRDEGANLWVCVRKIEA